LGFFGGQLPQGTKSDPPGGFGFKLPVGGLWGMDGQHGHQHKTGALDEFFRSAGLLPRFLSG
jgi:hypothetical protein